MNIHICAANGDLPALNAAIANGATLESIDGNGHTPLMAAIASRRANVEVVRLLIDNGADVNALAATGDDRAVSLLGVAVKTASLEKIRLLVERGADVRYVDTNGYSILLNAVYRTCSETAHERTAILDYLISVGAPLDAASRHNESVLSVCSHRGNFDGVKFFLKRGADPAPLEWTPLHFAVAFGSLDKVQSLVEQGATLELRDSWERTPFLLSVHAGRREIAQLLLDRGSDRSATGRCGHTALMYAIYRDDALMLSWLISQGCNVEETDEFGDFPLAVAAQCGASACVDILLQAGASPR